jgi:hypothetical protein
MKPKRHSSLHSVASRRSLFAAVAVAIVVHLNYWLWGSDRIVMGLPINLLYHLVLTLLLAVAMVVLVRRHWPAYLNDEGQE